MYLPKKIVFMILFMIACSVYAQSPASFITYAREASTGEGDNNFIQAIHFSVGTAASGKAFLRIFDIDCGGMNDNAYGAYDSRFEFDLLKGEISEEQFDSLQNNAEFLTDNLIKKFEIGESVSRDNQWMTFAELEQAEGNIYTLIIKGLGGNDANLFNVFISSDSSDNKNIPGSAVYSFEPTLRYERISRLISLNIKPFGDSKEISTDAFDLDKAQIYLNTFLRSSVKFTGDNSMDWMNSTVKLSDAEIDHTCSFSIVPGSKIYNDITIKFRDDRNRRLPVLFPAYFEQPENLPRISPSLIYVTCHDVDITLGDTLDSQGNRINYKWHFDNGLDEDGPVIKRNYEKPGTYSVEILAETNSEKITRAKVEKFNFTINNFPVIDAPDSLVGATGENIVFDASKSFDRDGRIVKYEWNFGDNSYGSRAVENHRYTSPGKYEVELSVEDNFRAGCNTSKKIIPVTINARPVASADYKQKVSIGEAVAFDASKSSDSDGGLISYSWDFGQFGKADGRIVEKSFDKPGTYNFKLTVRDDSKASNSFDTKEIKVFVNDKPSADAGRDKLIALGETLLFDASKSLDHDGKIIKYNWDFGDGNIASGDKISHAFVRPGVYNVKLRITDDSGTLSDSDSSEVKITVNAAPTAKIKNKIYSNDGHIIFDGAESQDSDGQISAYKWIYGDGSEGNGVKTVHDYKAPGEYRVILKVTDNTDVRNNFAYDTSKVIVDRRPIADAGPDLTIAAVTTLKFDSKNSSDPDGKIAAFKWFVDSREISDQSTAEFSFTEPKVYRVALEVTDDFPEPLSDIDYAEIKVNNPPVAVINCRLNSAPEEKLIFDGGKSTDPDGSIKNYKWHFSDNFTTEGVRIERTFKVPGKYSVILTVTDNADVSNSFADDTVMVSVNSAPEIRIKDDISTCDNRITFDASESFDPDGNDLSYTWIFPNSVTVNSGSVQSYTFLERGLLPVKLIVDDGLNLSNSKSEKTISVKINRPPVADAGPDTTVCAGELLILNALHSYDPDNELLKYTWVFDDSTKLEGSSVFRMFKIGGIYNVKLIVTDNSGTECSSAYDSKIIKVIEAPIANAGADITACSNSPVRFDGSKSSDVDGIVNSFDWDFGDGEFGGGSNPTHIYTKPGVYKVTLTVTGDQRGECDNSARDELIVTVNDAPFADFSSPDSAAVNAFLSFDASSSKTPAGRIVSYLWDFDDGSKDSGKVVSHVFKNFGQYKVSLLIKNDSGGECNSATCSKLIYINEKPNAVVKGNEIVLPGQLLYFDASGSADPDGKIRKYLWNFGDGTTAESIKPSHAYSKSGKYTVILKVIDDTGIENNYDNDTMTVLVKPEMMASFDLPEFIYTGKEITFSPGYISPAPQPVSYSWSVGPNVVSQSESFKMKFDKPGEYPVRLVVSENSEGVENLGEHTKYLKVVGYPELKLMDSLVVCENEEINIKPEIRYSLNDTGIKFKWYSSGDPQSYSAENLRVFPRSRKSVYYILELRDRDDFLFTKDSVFVKINHAPVAPALSDTTILIGRANDALKFDASKAVDEDGDAIKIHWDFGDGSTSDETLVLHNYRFPGEYRVELTLDDGRGNSCSIIKKSMTVRVNKPE